MDIAADDIGTGLHNGAGLTGLPPGRPENGRHSP